MNKSHVGGVTIVVALAAALLHSRPARMPQRAPLTPDVARLAYEEAAEKEIDERAEAVKKFPSSEWSQQDEFHNRESNFVRDYARSHRTAVRSVLDALDRGAHERWPVKAKVPPQQKVIPCRPRLTY